MARVARWRGPPGRGGANCRWWGGPPCGATSQGANCSWRGGATRRRTQRRGDLHAARRAAALAARKAPLGRGCGASCSRRRRLVRRVRPRPAASGAFCFKGNTNSSTIIFIFILIFIVTFTTCPPLGEGHGS